MTVYNIVLNSSNLVSSTNNNTFRYKFINGSVDIPPDSEMCVNQMILSYSFYNITSFIGNNSFSITYYNGSTSTTQTISLNNGFYTVSEITNALNSWFRWNGFYFYNDISSSGLQNTSYIYPVTFSSDANAYTNAITFQYIPPTNPTATPVTSSSISGNILTSGTAQTLEEGAFYMLSGSNVVPSSYIMGTGSSTATYYVNYSQTVSSESISYQLNYIWTMYGFGYDWRQGTSCRPAHSSTMTITFPANFGQLLGFSAGTYPTSSPIYLGANTSYSSDTITTENAQPLIILGNSLTSTTYLLNSGSTNFTVIGNILPFAPLGSTVNGIIVRCSLVNNPISMPTDILDVMNINVKFGSNIVYLLTIKSELDKNSIWKNG